MPASLNQRLHRFQLESRPHLRIRVVSISNGSLMYRVIFKDCPGREEANLRSLDFCLFTLSMFMKNNYLVWNVNLLIIQLSNSDKVSDFSKDQQNGCNDLNGQFETKKATYIQTTIPKSYQPKFSPLGVESRRPGSEREEGWWGFQRSDFWINVKNPIVIRLLRLLP